MKYVVIVNGKPRSGKDTFIGRCRGFLSMNEYARSISISSIDPVKDVLRKLGWNGEKSDEIRSLLSQLKSFWISNNDGPTAYLLNEILGCDKTGKIGKADDYVVFVQIREPEEIDKLRDAMIALKPLGIKVATVVVVRGDTDRDYDNVSDSHTHEYEYDYTIYNNGTIEQLKGIADAFIDVLLKEDKK